MAQAARQDEMFEEDIVQMPAEAWAKITTLKGDIRDRMLKWYGRQEKPWNQQSELEQKRTIWDIEDFSAKLVHEAGRLIAARGFEALPVTINKYAGNSDGFQATFTLRNSAHILSTIECCGKETVLVPLALSEFEGERAPAKPDVVGDLRIPLEGAAGATGAADLPPDPGEMLGISAAGKPVYGPKTGEVLPVEGQPGPLDAPSADVK